MKIDMKEISEEGSVTIVLRDPSDNDDRCRIYISGHGNGWINISHGCHSSTIYTDEIKRLARGVRVPKDVPSSHLHYLGGVHGDEELTYDGE